MLSNPGLCAGHGAPIRQREGLLLRLTSCKPFSIRAEGHAVPGRATDGIVEAMRGFELLLDVFSVRVRGQVRRQVELPQRPVGRVCDEAPTCP